MPEASIDQLSINTIRTLAIDAVQAAQSGHPGAPLGLAPAAYLLYTRIMKHNPADPKWADRDRFVLSAGHASMLLYACLHLSGYASVSLEDIKQFRQLGSRTPGHPENFETAGVETTTGPLGQGFGNGVGMAMAEKFLREKFGPEACDHHIFAICSDGDLMEGVSSEAASIAGHLRLGRLVYLYDDNEVTIDGPTSLSFSQEDVPKRFQAYGWHTLTVEDGNDLEAIEAAIRAGIAEESRPTLISLKTVIGYGSPRAGTRAAHSDPMPDEQVRATKEALGWDPDAQFLVPDEVATHFDQRARGAEAQEAWQARFDAWAASNEELASDWKDAWAGRPRAGFAAGLPVFEPAQGPISTRKSAAQVMQGFAPYVPTMVGGAADLIHSTFTKFDGDPDYTPEHAGRNVAWGVREHGMGASLNGLALHGGIVKPFCSTFFVFTDYMRPPIRLSALMKLECVWIFSHDSVAVGEDGPTHQPVEHLAAMRAIPNLTVIRPADANEASEAWGAILEGLGGPVCLVLSRQDVATLDRAVLAPAAGLRRGAYVLADVGSPDVVLVATGAEVGTALGARELLEQQGLRVRIVSMPSWELFEKQPSDYRDEVLPAGVPKISVEAGSTFGWSRWVDASIGIDSFGASGKGAKVLEHFGISPAGVAAQVQAKLAELV
ncbi:MAG TPA: transketolase [Gaiellaceae bacterium]|nr:transketolase [Gaiellaceae bacterium]